MTSLQPSSAPDAIELHGWRAWSVGKRSGLTPSGLDLFSLNSMGITANHWPPRAPVEAECVLNSAADHNAPVSRCTCGLYAATDVHALWRMGPPLIYSVVGRVSLYGRVIRHEFGYRAQYAEIVELFYVTPYPNLRSLPSTRIVRSLEETYGVPVSVSSWGALLEGDDFPPALSLHPKRVSPSEELERLTHKGMLKRYESPRKVEHRIERELRTLHDMDAAPAFLAAYDAVEWAKGNGVTVGPANGLAASAVAYALGINDVDPIRHDLVFETLLGRGVNEAPNIRITVAPDQAGLLGRYVREGAGRYLIRTVTQDNQLWGLDGLRRRNLWDVVRAERYFDEDSPETYRLLRAGVTSGIPHLEEDWAAALAVHFDPTSFNELCLLVLGLRPKNGWLADAVVDSQESRRVDWKLASVNQVVASTVGIPLFVDQRARILRTALHCSWEKAVRILQSHPLDRSGLRRIFVYRMCEKGMPKGVAEALWDFMIVEHGFSRADVAGDAMLVAKMAFFKSRLSKSFASSVNALPEYGWDAGDPGIEAYYRDEEDGRS